MARDIAPPPLHTSPVNNNKFAAMWRTWFEKIHSAFTLLNTDLTTAEASITTLQTDLNTAESNITTLQNDLNTAESAITTLETDVGTLQTDLATAQGDITDLQVKAIVRAYATGTTTVNATTWTQVAFGGETVDTDSIYNTSTSTITIAVTGYYMVGSEVTFTTNEVPIIAIKVNSTRVRIRDPNTSEKSIFIEDILYLSANDTVTIEVYCASAATVDSLSDQTDFFMHKI